MPPVIGNQVTWNTQSNGIAVPVTTTPATDLLRLPEVSADRPFLNTGNTVFWNLLNAIGAGESASQPRYDWFEDDKFSTMSTSNAGYSDSVTTVVATSANILPRATVKVMRTGEIMYVSAVSGASLTVIRGYFGTTAAAILADDVFIIMATNLPEGADAGDALGQLPERFENFVTVYSATVRATNMQELTDMRFNVGTKEDNYSRSYNWLMEQMDNQLRHGVKGMEEVSGRAIYSTGGITQLVNNSLAMGSNTSRADWRAALLPSFTDTASSPRKLLMGGSDVVASLIATQAAVTSVSPTTFDPVIGANITTMDLGAGMVVDVVQDLQGFSTARGLSKSFYLLDPAHIKLRPFNGMEGLVSRDVSRKEGHECADEIFGSTGLEVRHGQSDVHAIGSIA